MLLSLAIDVFLVRNEEKNYDYQVRTGRRGERTLITPLFSNTLANY